MFLSETVELVLRNQREREERFFCKRKDLPLQHVSDWKDKWEYYVYEGKPIEITKDTWDGLIAYWKLPSPIRKANSCSASRRTKDKDGHFPMVYRTGQKPMLGSV